MILMQPFYLKNKFRQIVEKIKEKGRGYIENMQKIAWYMQLLAEGVHFVDGDFKDMIYKD